MNELMSYHHRLVYVQGKHNRNTHVNRHRLYQFAFHLGQQWLHNINPRGPIKKRVRLRDC